MKNVINLRALRHAREKFAIALAGTVHETFYRDPADPISIQFDLAELADEILSLGDEKIDKDYLVTVSWFAKQRGKSIVFFDDAGVAAHHNGALEWARDLLERTQTGFGARLLGRGRA